MLFLKVGLSARQNQPAQASLPPSRRRGQKGILRHQTAPHTSLGSHLLLMEPGCMGSSSSPHHPTQDLT